MIIKKIVGILLLFIPTSVLLAQSEKHKIYLELKIEVTPQSKSISDSITISYASYPLKLWDTWILEAKHNSNTKWSISTDKPILLDIWGVTILNKYNRWLLEPNDSIIVTVREGTLHFSGHGADKLKMNNEICGLIDAMPKPFNPFFYTVLSVEDFLEWDSYLNRRMALSELIMESYKDLVSPLANYYTKAQTIMEIEDQRRLKFQPLYSKKNFDLDRQIVSKLFDEHFFTPKIKWILDQPMGFVRQLPVYGQFFRKYNFANKTELASSEIELNLMYWEYAKKEYQGEGLEEFLAWYLTYWIIHKEGFQPLVDSTLIKYYADKDRDPKYQAYVKGYERKERVLKQFRTIPSFTVFENKSKTYTRSGLDGKVAVLHFTKPGNKTSELTAKYLEKIEKNFNNDPYVKFLDLPVNLQPDSVIKKFNITSYPAVFVLDLTGRLITSSFIDSSLNASKINKIIDEQALVAKREAWQGSMDGPYIMKEGHEIKVYKVMIGKITAKNERLKTFPVATDQPGKTFNVMLKDHYVIEPSTFPQPEKLLAFSDIEGEFEPLRLLLQKNNVMDEQFNWVFGKGHVVFAGDMFDRGEQVTECLWLMYSLEEKAKAAGGYVHFILGNHEIMNLNGNHKYTRSKYIENAQKINKSLVELYGDDSELGKWLRSKNIVEKIGDILFLHAGISKDVNDLGLTVGQINELARPFYDNYAAVKKSGDKRLELLYNSELSPFWYRDYYLETPVKKSIGNNRLYVSYKTSGNVIDDVLKKYEVNKIVTGHTVWEGVRDMDRGKLLSVHYDGKVINLDTYHKRGYSEALFIENEKYYAVNKNGGKRELLRQVVSKLW